MPFFPSENIAAILNFKMAASERLICLYISGSKPPHLLNLVSNKTYSWTRNPLRALLIIMSDSVLEAIFNFKMAAN
jgi:hypothetical protein